VHHKTAIQGRVLRADANFLSVIALPLVAGSAQSALLRPDAMMVSESYARKLFGSDEAIVGRTARSRGGENYVVTAVFADLPATSHLVMDALVPFRDGVAKGDAITPAQWAAMGNRIYLKLAENADMESLDKRLQELTSKGDALVFPREKGAKDPLQISSLPIADIHLNGLLASRAGKAADLETLLAMAAIGIAILIMAAINFTNLSLAQSFRRFQEIALRRLFGAARRHIAAQFFCEAFLVAWLGLLGGLAEFGLLRPWFESLVGVNLAESVVTWPTLIFYGTALILLIAVLAEAYPAWLASRYRPAQLIHGNLAPGTMGNRLRSVLVGLQFVTAMVLMTGTVVVYRQIQFISHADLGFDADDVMVVWGDQSLPPQRLASIESALLGKPGVQDIAMTSIAPGDRSLMISGLKPIDGGSEVAVEVYRVEVSYFDLLGITASSGRVFSRSHPEDRLAGEGADRKAGIVLNESAARRLGLDAGTQTAGSPYNANLDGSGPIAATLIGVIPDIHLRSFREPLRPALFLAAETPFKRVGAIERLLIRIDPAQRDAAVSNIEAVWHEMAPRTRINRTFLSQQMAKQYAAEHQRGRGFATAASVAIIIAMLGLFGLSAIAVERRRREIGMRKVLGARVRDVLRLLAWQFTQPVLIASLIATPIAALFMRRWLQGFTYRIPLDPWPFVAAGGTALIVALLTVTSHALRVARTHPTLALRME